MKLLFLLLALATVLSVAYGQDTISESPHLVYIRPGSVLVRISDKKEFVTDKGIYTKVQERQLTKRDVFNVYNSNNELTYTTVAENILEIAEDIRIFPKVNAEIIYPAPTTRRTSNKSFNFDSQLNLHLDSLNPDAFSSYYPTDSTNVASTRYEFRTMYQGDLLVDFGINISLQKTSWLADDQHISSLILAIGPVIEYPFYQKEELTAKVVIGAEFTPIYETQSALSLESYSALIFDLGLELNYDTKYGAFIFGTHFRKHELNLSSSTRINDQGFEQEEISYHSVGLMLGYKLDWQL